MFLAWWQSNSQIFLNLVMLARPEDMPTNCLNRIATTVLATGFLPLRHTVRNLGYLVILAEHFENFNVDMFCMCFIFL